MAYRRKPILSPDWLRVSEVAQRLNVTPQTILKYARNGNLGCRTIRFGPALRISRIDFERRYGVDSATEVNAS